MPELTPTYAPIPILWKSSDIAEKRARSLRRLHIGIAASLLVHALLFLLVKLNPEILNPAGDGPAAPAPLVVQLNPGTPREAVVTPPADIKPPPRPQSTIMAVPRRNPQAPTVPLTQPEPAPPVTPKPVDPDQPSMMAMVEAARARRQASEDALKRLNAEMRAGDGSAGGKVPRQSTRNLQTLSKRDGTSGVFQIIRRSPPGQFASAAGPATPRQLEGSDRRRGRPQATSNRHGAQDDRTIRKHYTGNNWESTVSAGGDAVGAMEDSADWHSDARVFDARNQ
jgi:hypothetical protein